MTPMLWLSPSLREPKGRGVSMSWSVFAQRVETARAAPSKESLARWAPVEFTDGRRCLANVVRVHAVVLDVDDGSALAPIVGNLKGLLVIAHSTFSATTERPRWRIIVPLDHPVDAGGYDRVWRWLAAKLEAAGVRPDYAARDASRAWAVPARPPSGFYVAQTFDGAFADVCEALAAIPKPEPLPVAPPRSSVDSYTYAGRLVRARQYLSRMPGALAGSGGHRATFAAACVLVRGFALEQDDALALLIEVHNPLCAPPWSERELRHKVKQAHQRARLPLGFLADRGSAA
jgi:hypothetical protein